MGFENFDLWWQDLKELANKYGYKLGCLNDKPTDDLGWRPEHTITAIFYKENEE